MTVPAETVVHAAVERVQRTLQVPGIDPDQRQRLQEALDQVGDLPNGRPLLEGPLLLRRVGHPDLTALIGLLACDCTLQRVVLDAAGYPLDVGRSGALATPPNACA